jgi:hypothetical protein
MNEGHDLNNSISDRILAIALAAIGLLVVALWNFPTAFGLDFDSAAEVVIGLIPLAAIWALLRYTTPIPLRDTWPVALAGLWFCSWPALDYWSGPEAPQWYALPSVDWGVMAGIVTAGYVLRACLKKTAKPAC